MEKPDFILIPVSIEELYSNLRKIVKEELYNEALKKVEERLLTPKQTAELFQVSTVSIWQWEKQGRIMKHTMGGRTYFKYSEVMSAIESGVGRKYQKYTPSKY